VSGQIQTLSTQLGSWEGSAGDAYRAHLKELSDGLDKIVSIHQDVPTNLHRAADSVDTALSKIPLPDELVEETLQARQQFKETGQLDTKFHQGFFADRLFPGFMDLAGDIFGFLTFGLADKASDMLRDFLSDGDDQAKQAYQELNGQHTGTQSAMASSAARGEYGQLETQFNPDLTDTARTANPSAPPGTGGYGTALQSAGGAGPIPAVPSASPSGLGSIGAGLGTAGGIGTGAAGVGGIGCGGAGGSGVRPGGLTSAGNAIRGGVGGMGGMPMGGMAGAAGGARGGSGGVRGAGGASAGAGRAGGMGGMPMMGGAGAAGARGGAAGGGRTGVPGVAAGKAGGPGGAGAAGRGMAPMMGGAHGGGSGDATDHSTWLQEDEDVWGSDSDAAPPVLGS
jgi:hypothetical protein